MENASQALLIVAGVLLGILTVTMLVHRFSTISAMGNANEAKTEAKMLAEWNAEWQAYNKHLLYGTEVLTVINKAEQNNKVYTDDEYQVIITGIDDRKQEMDTQDFKEFVKEHKTSIFECKDVKYSNTRQG